MKKRGYESPKGILKTQNELPVFFKKGEWISENCVYQIR